MGTPSLPVKKHGLLGVGDHGFVLRVSRRTGLESLLRIITLF
jgi:hypothetical protein